MMSTLDEAGDRDQADDGLFAARGLGRLVYGIARRIHLGRVTAERYVDLAWRDCNGRLTAAEAALGAFDHFADCPGIPPAALDRARARFVEWRARAQAHLEMLVREAPDDLIAAARRRYATDLSRVSSKRSLEHLERVGLVSSVAVEHATASILVYLERRDREAIDVPVPPDEGGGA
jgi:hypothetical protein